MLLRNLKARVKLSADVIYQSPRTTRNGSRPKNVNKKNGLGHNTPTKIRIIPKLVFRYSKPAIAGVEILGGTVKKDYGLIREDGTLIGKVESMQDKGDNLQSASKGSKVAMAIKEAVFDRDFEEGEILYVNIPENHFKILETELKGKLNDDELNILHEIGDIKRKEDPHWALL